MLPKTAAPRIVVLKGDRLYGDLICRQIKEYWRNAAVQFFQLGFDALEAIQTCPPDMFIAGVKIADMDGPRTSRTIRRKRSAGFDRHFPQRRTHV